VRRAHSRRSVRVGTFDDHVFDHRVSSRILGLGGSCRCSAVHELAIGCYSAASGRLLPGDLVRAVPPTEEDDIPDDEVLWPRVREGDVLVPHVARQLIARVAQGQDIGAVLSS